MNTTPYAGQCLSSGVGGGDPHFGPLPPTTEPSAALGSQREQPGEGRIRAPIDRYAQEVVRQIQIFAQCFTARNRARTAKKSRFGLYSSGFSATRFLTKAKKLGKNKGAEART